MRTAVTTAVNGLKRNRSSPQKMRLKWGRWDRNRTGNLRLWSLLPFVQQRSETYTKGLEMAHFDGRKYDILAAVVIPCSTNATGGDVYGSVKSPF